MNCLEVNINDLQNSKVNLESFSRLTSRLTVVEENIDSILTFDSVNDRFNEVKDYSFNIDNRIISISSNDNSFNVCINLPEFVENEVIVEYFCFINSGNAFLLYTLDGKQKNLFRCDKTGSITFNLTFPLQYNLISTNDYKVITNFETNLYLIIDNDGLSHNFTITFPPLSEIQVVLIEKLTSSIQKLFQFWLDIYEDLVEILRANKPIDSKIKCYLQVLTIHITLSLGIMMDYIYNNSDKSKHSNFHELLINIANEYITKMLNKLLAIQESMNKLGLETEFVIISENISVLSIVCEELRKISLTNRFPKRLMNTLSVKKHILSKISFDNSDDKIDDDVIQIKNKQRNEIIRQHLINGRIAELKRGILKSTDKQVKDSEILEQQKNIVYSKIHIVEWTELKNIIKKLGLNPQSCLTLMCMETVDKETRSLIYQNLERDMNSEPTTSSELCKFDKDLTEQHNNMRMIKTNIVDPFDKCFAFPTSTGKCYSLEDDEYLDESSVPSYADSIVKKFGTSEKNKIATLLSTKSPLNPTRNKSQSTGDVKHLVNLRMIWFVDLIQRSDSVKWKKMFDLCLIDGDFQKMFTQIDFEDKDIETLCTFISTWESKPDILLQYIILSTNEQVIFKFYQILTNQKPSDLQSANEIVDSMNQSFLEILLTNRCTKIDRKLTEIDIHNVKSAIWLCLSQNNGCEIDLGYRLLKLVQDRKEELELSSNKLLPINLMHYICQNDECIILNGQKPLQGISDGILKQMIIKELEKYSNPDTESSYQPNFTLFCLLQDYQESSFIELDGYPDLEYSSRKTLLHHLSLLDNDSKIATKFLSYLSAETVDLPNNLSDNQLDEILYAVLLCGISYADLLQSKDPIFVKINKILSTNQYKERLRLRLIRRSSSLPANQTQEKSSDELSFEEYYSVDLMDFLDKSGSAVSRKYLFGDDKPIDPENHQCVTLTDLQHNHRDLYEHKRPQLDYIYYLSLCRPYQAFISILKEFSSPNRPQHLHVDVMKDLVRNIHIIALTNCLDNQIIGSCFVLLRLLKWSVEPLKCYFNLLDWLVDWSYKQYTKQNLYVTPTDDDEREKTVKDQYQNVYAELLVQCHSKDVSEKKEAWEFVISDLETVFLNEMEPENEGISDLLCIWGRILYFCQLMNMPPSIKLLKHYAQNNNWLMFLIVAQVFGYSKDQVKETLNYFKDSSIRHHIGYVVTKVTEISLDSSAVKMREKNKKISIRSNSHKSTDETMINNNTGTNSQNSQSEQAPIGTALPHQTANQKRRSRKLSNQRNLKSTAANNNKSYLPSNNNNNNISFSNVKLTKSSLVNRAKSNLLELLFDCQYRENYMSSILSDSHIHLPQSLSSSSKSVISLSSDRLLAYCVALSHPFLAVLACYGVNDKGIPITDVEPEANYINCLSCFIVASLSGRTRNEILANFTTSQQNFSKSANQHVKIKWKENDWIRLVMLCVEHGEVATIYDAISVMRPLGFDHSSLMMSQAPYSNHQHGINLKYQTVLIGFWKLLTTASSGNTIQRILSLRQLVFNTVDLVHLINHNNQRHYHGNNQHSNTPHLYQHNYPPLLLLWRRIIMHNNCQILSLTLTSVSSNNITQNYRLIDDWLNELWTDPVSHGLSNQALKQKLYDFSEFGVLWQSIRLYSNMKEFIDTMNKGDRIAAEKFKTLPVPVNIRNSNFVDFVSTILEMVPTIYDNKFDDQGLVKLMKDGIALIEAILDTGLPLAPIPKWESIAEDFRGTLARATMNTIKPNPGDSDYDPIADVLCMGLSGQSDMEDIVFSCLPCDPLNPDTKQQHIPVDSTPTDITSVSSSLTVELSSVSTLTNSEPQLLQKKHSISSSFKLKKDYGSTSDNWRRMLWPEEWQNDIMNLTPGHTTLDLHETENISHVKSLLYDSKWIEACSYMIEHNVYVVDALLILVGMKIASGRMDPLKLPSSIRETVNIGLRRSSTQVTCTQAASSSSTGLKKTDTNLTIVSGPILDTYIPTLNFSGLGARRRNSAAFFLKSEENAGRRGNSTNPQKRLSGSHAGGSSENPHSFLMKLLSVLTYGQEIMERVLTLYCVAKNMRESYTQLIQNKEFDVLTKILTGPCKDKIETARMYLQIVNINVQKMASFLANITIRVLEAELLPGHVSQRRTNLVSSLSSSNPNNQLQTSSVSFNLNSPIHSPMTKIKHNSGVTGSLSPNQQQQQFQHQQYQQFSDFTNFDDDCGSISELELQKISFRCSLRPDWNTNNGPYQTNVFPDIQSSNSPTRFQNSVPITPLGNSTNYSTNSSSTATPITGSNIVGEARLMKAFFLQELMGLTPSYWELGNILYKHYMRMSQILNKIDEADFLVNLLILSHTCFTECGDTIGISHCLKSAKDIYKFLVQNKLYLLMAYLLCRIGRYGEMPYIIKTLIENEHFELLLRKDMDREGKIVPYLLDYLKRYLQDDYEKVEMVCSKYHCFYELACIQSKRAEAKEIKLKNDFIKNSSKDELKSRISSIVIDLLNSCKYYFKVGCYRKTMSNFRRAQFFLLQERWLEDSSKTFSNGILSRSIKTTTTKVNLPDSGFPYGVMLINLNKEQATYFMKKVPDFYTAYLIINHFKLPESIWKDLIVLHVILNGDHEYLENYLFYITSVIPASFIQQCMNILQRMSIKPLSKQGLDNIKTLLHHSDDKSIFKEIEEKYKLK